MATKKKPKKTPAPPAATENLPSRVDLPMKFTPETRQKILSAIGNGCYRFQACALAGIDRRTLLDWETRAEAAPDGEHAVFVAELERVQFAAEAKLQMIHNALSTGGKLPDEIVGQLTADPQMSDFRQRAMLPALQAQLKYGGSRPWAEVQKIEHSGPGGKAIQIISATPEAAAALLREGFGGHARKALEDVEPEESAPKGE